MSINVAHRRILGERVTAFIRKSDPDLHDMSSVCEALADVMTDILGAQCRIVCKIDAKALDKAIAIAEATEKAGA
jgi:hypothetical protein